MADTGEGEPVHGAGDADIEEPTLFFQFLSTAAFEGPDIGQNTVFKAADVDLPKFEAFGGMEGEEVDGVA